MDLHRKATLVALTVAVVGAGSPALGAVVVDIMEDGTDVVATASGSINLGAFTGPFTPPVPETAAILPPSHVIVGPPYVADVYPFPAGLVGPSSFGPGTTEFQATSVSGDSFGFAFGVTVIGMYPGYVSGSALSGSATFAGQTLASMGLAAGTYTWTWGSGATADSFTINVIAAVPASTQVTRTLLLLGVALSGAVVLRRRIAPNHE